MATVSARVIAWVLPSKTIAATVSALVIAGVPQIDTAAATIPALALTGMFQSDAKPAPEPAAPAATVSVAESIRKGEAWLVSHQNKDGSWGAPTVGRPYEVLATVPESIDAFEVATSALCVMALVHESQTTPAMDAVIRKGLRHLLEKCNVRRPNGMEFYNTWTFAYSLQCFAETIASKRFGDLEADMRSASAVMIEKLHVYQTLDGGWSYLDFRLQSAHPSDSSMTFTTATVLVAFSRAQAVGIEVPKKLVDDGVRVLRRARKEDGSYIYGQYLAIRPELGVNAVKGSLGRTQACHYALRLFGQNVTDADLKKGMENLFTYHQFIDIGRKRPIPHEAWYNTSGYFYLYGHYYARLVLDLLPASDQAALWPKLRDAIVPLQEPDGCWWDYPLYDYHRPYGTAYALLTLQGRN
ncbi:MAG: hypothetical protein HYR85_13230 [Planctomycetes bacterium]|nr:hypothetical protein [Planctomycetota bacterium]MBI3847866.1 hypothetical protein [Planctomycetota bacterium]